MSEVSEISPASLTEEAVVHVSEEDPSEKLPALSGERRKKLIAVSSRTAVWGVIIGLGELTALAGGIDIPAWIGQPVNGIAFLLGGIGAFLTSLFVSKDLKEVPWTIKAATALGFPFGISLAALGVGFLWEILPGIGWSVALLAAPILGVLLVILLLAGFIGNRLRADTPLED